MQCIGKGGETPVWMHGRQGRPGVLAGLVVQRRPRTASGLTGRGGEGNASIAGRNLSHGAWLSLQGALKTRCPLRRPLGPASAAPSPDRTAHRKGNTWTGKIAATGGCGVGKAPCSAAERPASLWRRRGPWPPCSTGATEKGPARQPLPFFLPSSPTTSTYQSRARVCTMMKTRQRMALWSTIADTNVPAMLAI